MAPVIFGIMVVGLTASYLQVGFVYSPEVIRPTFDKINPMNGIKKILISRRSAMELVKSLVKVSVVGLVAYMAIKDVITESPTLMESDPSAVMGYLSQCGVRPRDQGGPGVSGAGGRGLLLSALRA